MDDDKIVALIAQYFSEKGFTASLAALRDDHGIDIDMDLCERGGELISRLTNDYDAQLAHELRETQLDQTTVRRRADFSELAERPRRLPLTRLQTHMTSVHEGNILAVKFHPDAAIPILWTGGADKTLKCVHYGDAAVREQLGAFSGPVLSLGLQPVLRDVLLATDMSGSYHLVDVPSLKRIHSHRKSLKYLSRCCWSPDGKMFCVSSYDHSLSIFGLDDSNAVTELKMLRFPANVEAMTFSPSGDHLVFVVRGDHCVSFLNRKSLTIDQRVNMNANGDPICSFTVLDIHFDATSKYLLLATDRNRLILMHVPPSTSSDPSFPSSPSSSSSSSSSSMDENVVTGVHVRDFYGCSNDEYSMPRCGLDPQLEYIYCTSQDKKVYCWDTFSQSVVARLDHGAGPAAAVVRDMDMHPSGDLLATVAYDKSVRIFGRPFPQ